MGGGGVAGVFFLLGHRASVVFPRWVFLLLIDVLSLGTRWTDDLALLLLLYLFSLSGVVPSLSSHWDSAHATVCLRHRHVYSFKPAFNINSHIFMHISVTTHLSCLKHVSHRCMPYSNLSLCVVEDDQPTAGKMGQPLKAQNQKSKRLSSMIFVPSTFYTFCT